MRFQKLAAAVLAFGLVACGNSVLPTDPTPTVDPGPQQTVLGLVLTARVEGNIAISVNTDAKWTVEAGAQCTDANLPCPRPTSIEWAVTGAFCEKFGPTGTAGVIIKCRGFGVARVTAYDKERPGVRGELQIEVAPIF